MSLINQFLLLALTGLAKIFNKLGCVPLLLQDYLWLYIWLFPAYNGKREWKPSQQELISVIISAGSNVSPWPAWYKVVSEVECWLFSLGWIFLFTLIKLDNAIHEWFLDHRVPYFNGNQWKISRLVQGGSKSALSTPGKQNTDIVQLDLNVLRNPYRHDRS